MASETLVTAELIVKIIAGSLAIVGLMYEAYTGHLRGVLKALTAMPADIGQTLHSLEQNQEQIIDQQDELAHRLEDVEEGVEIVGVAINEGREVRMEKLREKIDADKPADSYLRGGDAEFDGGEHVDGADHRGGHGGGPGGSPGGGGVE